MCVCVCVSMHDYISKGQGFPQGAKASGPAAADLRRERERARDLAYIVREIIYISSKIVVI